jgi:AraC-like DNA-binding protein
MGGLTNPPLVTHSKAQPTFEVGVETQSAKFIEVLRSAEHSTQDESVKTPRTRSNCQQDGRERLLWQLLVGEGESLRRLYRIVGEAGFKIVFCHNERSDAFVQNAASAIPTLAVGGLTPRTLRRVCDHIETHLAHPIGLEALATMIGLSRCYFARAFKHSIGMTPHHYLMQRRLEHAKRLLVETEISLAQIALESGFSDQSHFTRRFRDHVGSTPRAYRQLGR